MNEWMKSIFLLSQRTFINEKECVMHLNVYDYEIFVNCNVPLCKSNYIVLNIYLQNDYNFFVSDTFCSVCIYTNISVV